MYKSIMRGHFKPIDSYKNNLHKIDHTFAQCLGTTVTYDN